ncbi:hypothetical protein LI072_08145, partial [bacterium 210928-DFI.3.100]|nr:hypothetical protein [bacterium 210928-DFI.3.100]
MNHSRYTKKKYTAAPEMQCFRGFSLHSKATDKAAIGSFVCSSVMGFSLLSEMEFFAVPKNG